MAERNPERIVAWFGNHGTEWRAKDFDSVRYATKPKEYVRADLYARLQEQVETANADRDRWYESSFAATDRAEAAEAERDRLREENDRLKRGLMGMAMFAKPAALKKEPQP